MSAWWLFAIIPGYIFTGGFAGGLLYRYGPDDEVLPVFGAIFWPLVPVIAVIAVMGMTGARVARFNIPRRKELQ